MFVANLGGRKANHTCNVFRLLAWRTFLRDLLVTEQHACSVPRPTCSQASPLDCSPSLLRQVFNVYIIPFRWVRSFSKQQDNQRLPHTSTQMRKQRASISSILFVVHKQLVEHESGRPTKHGCLVATSITSTTQSHAT